MRITLLMAIALLLSAAPLVAQTAEQATEQTADKAVEETKQPAATSDADELRSAARLPEAAKEAREAGTEEDEIADVVKGVQEKKLSTDEGVNTIRIMKENSDAGESNEGISDFVHEQKAKGVQGEDLGKAVQAELQARHRVRVEEGKGATERKEKRTGTGEETQQQQGRGGKGKGQKGKSQSDTQSPAETPEQESTDQPVQKTTK